MKKMSLTIIAIAIVLVVIVVLLHQIDLSATFREFHGG